MRTNCVWLGAILALAASVGCARSVEVAAFGEQSTDGGAGSDCEIQACGGRVFACGDCEDNDGDGLRDAEDPDCWGVCHDSEQVWAPSRVCSNQSCFFDQNCGLGNDEECVSLAPNGCDCFGCCEVSRLGRAVYLGTVNADNLPTCGASTAEDETMCAPCEIDFECFNVCDLGEACL